MGNTMPFPTHAPCPHGEEKQLALAALGIEFEKEKNGPLRLQLKDGLVVEEFTTSTYNLCWGVIDGDEDRVLALAEGNVGNYGTNWSWSVWDEEDYGDPAAGRLRKKRAKHLVQMEKREEEEREREAAKSETQRKYESLRREFRITQETTAGTGARGQIYIDTAYNKLKKFCVKNPDFELPAPAMSYNDGSGGLSTGLSIGVRALAGF